jgi:hypothetical protein
MCLGSNPQPVGANPQDRQMRGMQLIGSLLQANRGNPQAAQNLATFRTMFQAAHPAAAARQPVQIGGR